MLKNKLMRLAVLVLAFVMLMALTATADETAVSDDTTLTFGIFSDIHNASNYMANVMNNFETLADGNENIDGIVMVGDIAYLDTNQTPVASTYNIINNNEDVRYFKDAGKLAFAMGNHEIPLNANDEATCTLSKQVFTEQVGQAPESHHVFEGYHFITAGPYNYNGVMSADQEQYVMDEVTKALADGTDKPVFVFIHHPIDNTLYGTSNTTRHSEEFENFLKADPRVVIFSGHMHFPISDPRSIYQIKGGSTFIYTSSVNGGNKLTNPYATQSHDTSFPSQAYLMDIDSETNVITLKRFYVNSTDPTYIEGGDWVIDIPAMVAESKKAEAEIDTANVYKYTYAVREENSVAPAFDEAAAITVSDITTNSVSLTFPEAKPGAEGEDNYVGYYKIDIYNKRTGETVTKKIISDYFLKTKRTAFGCSFDSLDYDTEYTLSVTPLNMWYVEGTPITVDFTSAKLPAGFGTIVGYDESYFAAPVTLNENGDGASIDTSKAFRITDENNSRLAGIYAVSKDNFITNTFVYVYGPIDARRALYEMADGKLAVISGGGKGKLSVGAFSSNGWIGVPSATVFYSDSQWGSAHIKAYFAATDDEEGTEGAKTAEEKKLEILAEMIQALKTQNQYVAYTLNSEEIVPVNEVSSLRFGFHLSSVYGNVSMTIKNNAYRLVAYVMDSNGNVTTHGISSEALTMKYGSASYGTFDFKTGEWDTPLPENGYLVAFKIDPYYGLSDPKDITLTTSKASVDEIHPSEKVRFAATPSTYTIDIPKAPAPQGITVEDATFSGLDKNTTYSLAPYSVSGADSENAVEITGVTSYTLPEGAVGLYGIYIKGNGVDNNDSDAFIAYVRGTYTARQDIHDRTADGFYALSKTVTPGTFSCVGSWSTNSAFTKTAICTTGDHVTLTQFTPLYNAYIAEDATDETKAAAFETFLNETKLEDTHLQYNFAADEIIPISEVAKYSYKITKQRGGFTYNDQVSEFIALIMDNNGNIKEYTYQHKTANLGDTVTKVIDFKNQVSSDGKWVDALPEEGYLVAFKLMVYANLDDFSKVAVSSVKTGTRYLITPDVEYTVEVPKAVAPKGITVDGTTFKGLNSAKTYSIAPYSAAGIDTALVQTVTGVTEFDVADSFESPIGVYVVYIKGDGANYTDSDIGAVCYIQGTLAEKKDVVFTDGKYNIYPVKWADINSWSAGNIVAPQYFSDATLYKVPYTNTQVLSTWFLPGSTSTDTNKENLPKVRFAYAYSPEEIPTVEELNGFKFSIGRQNSSLVAQTKAKVNFVVLSDDGIVTNHSVMTEPYQFKVGSNSGFTVNFKDLANLPENGYVLGFEVYPFAELISMTPENTSFSNLGVYFYFSNYSISPSKANAPVGITAEGTSFKGLDETKTYIVAPYTVLGAIEEEKKTVTGATSVDIATLYENPVGIYGIYYDATEYNEASELGAVIYIESTFAARKDLGNTKTYTYTWNNGANSMEYSVAEFEKVKESDKEWSLGKLAGAEYFIYNGTDYYSYKCDWMYYTPSSKALYEAEQANDGSLEILQKQAEATLESVSFRYAYSPDEIIPIKDVVEMKFAVARSTTYINVTDTRSKYVLYVMNTDGTISQHACLTAERTIDSDISGNRENLETISPAKNFFDLPEEGWIIGYKFYPYGDVNPNKVTYNVNNIAKTDTQYAFYFRAPLVTFEDTYTILGDKVEFGMSLLLDGKIGIKVTALGSENASDFALSNVEGTNNYTDFGTNDYAIFYFAPKDVATATVSFDVTYTDAEGTATESFTLTVAEYIDALRLSGDEKVAKLGNAFDTFFKATYNCLNGITAEALADLTAEELADLEAKATYNKTGSVAGIEFHSSSLVLEEDTAIRHYFVITDDSIETDVDLAQRYTVTGGTALKLSDRKDNTGFRYAYTDVADISSNELANVKTVTVSDVLGATVKVDFNALAYADLCLDKDDVKLLNLAKALYRYSVESEAYMAD